MEAGYQVYKGLQKPLVFKSFRGRYIYWGLTSLLAGLISAMVVSALSGILPGLLVAGFILGAGLGYTAYRQQRGPKKAVKGLYIMPNNPLHNAP